jgi:serine phosphatase RsbU (regulator of sigma subunit)
MARVMAVDGGWLVIIIDASGHGRAASEVAQHALEVMGRNATSQVESIFLRVHDALKGSGGAAVGVMFLDDSSSMLRYAGVGNTRAMKTGSAGEWVGISRDGVLGNRLPNLHIQETAMAPGDLIVLWTDGVSDFEVRKLATKNAFKAEEEIAKMIVSQLAKPYDDACCLTLRWR